MKSLKDEIEQIMEKVHYAKLFDTWVQNFAVNLNNIWNESSARELTLNQNNMNKNSNNWNRVNQSIIILPIIAKCKYIYSFN